MQSHFCRGTIDLSIVLTLLVVDLLFLANVKWIKLVIVPVGVYENFKYDCVCT